VETSFDEQGRPEPPQGGGELDTLVGFLEFLRSTVAWKCADLDVDGLNTSLSPSDMTLGGLLKHLSYVEDHWFNRRLHDNPPAPPWDTVDWEADRDWDWHSAAADSPEELRALWQTSVERSRALLAQALETAGLDQPAAQQWPDGTAPSLRWILVHMVEEYGRHSGHADLIRQAIDGQTGE